MNEQEYFAKNSLLQIDDYYVSYYHINTQIQKQDFSYTRQFRWVVDDLKNTQTDLVKLASSLMKIQDNANDSTITSEKIFQQSNTLINKLKIHSTLNHRNYNDHTARLKPIFSTQATPKTQVNKVTPMLKLEENQLIFPPRRVSPYKRRVHRSLKSKFCTQIEQSSSRQKQEEKLKQNNIVSPKSYSSQPFKTKQIQQFKKKSKEFKKSVEQIEIQIEQLESLQKNYLDSYINNYDTGKLSPTLIITPSRFDRSRNKKSRTVSVVDQKQPITNLSDDIYNFQQGFLPLLRHTKNQTQVQSRQK